MNNSNLFFAAGMPGGWELILILGVILLFFGGAKLPSLAKGIGQSIKEFKKAAKEGSADDEDAPKADVKKAETTKTS